VDNYSQIIETESASNVVYPPKYLAEQGSITATIYRSLLSIVFFLGVGYLFFQRIDIILILTAIILFHEAGHYFAMRYYHYADLGIFFIPILGAFVSGSKREVSQKQNAVILMAGPLPGIILGFLLFFIDKNTVGGWYWGDISVYYVSILLLVLNLLNLLPVYPLDGGQLLNRVFLDEEGFWSNTFVWISAIGFAVLAFISGLYILLLLPLMIVFRYVGTNRHLALEKELLDEGFDLDTSYEDLSDEKYWKIRAVIVRNLPTFAGVEAGPPYQYDAKEEKIAQEVEDVLQRNLLLDISWFEKIILVIIWILALCSPIIFNIDLNFLKNFLQF
jgi:stage IV sporulation protein FB